MNFFYGSCRQFLKLLFKILYRHRVYGINHTKTAGGILAANHLSFLDPPLIAVSTPDEVHFLAENYLFKLPLLRPLILQLNAHSIKGSSTSLNSLKLACRLLHEDKKVVVFPEGRRSLDGKIAPFELGISMLALKTGRKITPIYIGGTFEAWNCLQRWPKLFGRTVCIFGSPIDPQSYFHLDKKEAKTLIALRVKESIEELQAWYLAGAKGLPP